ncbi:MAG TPA: class I SAM-dependent methyltransferase [Candidatus Paceibacterota bacterium]|nr:class I SAM-dependent methyltransferase [Candidatus Paceibacterota bacterium]
MNIKLPTTNLQYFQGIDGVKELLNILLEAGGKEHHTFGSSKDGLMLGNEFWLDYHKRRAAKGIKAKLIFTEHLKHWVNDHKYQKAEYKFIKKSFGNFSETIIRNDKVGIIVWSKVPIGILIHNKVAADSYNKIWKIMWDTNRIMISGQRQWAKVLKELEAEKIKLAYYDNTLLAHLGRIKNKKALDYGSGPGVLATALLARGADCKIYDISPEIRKRAGERIGFENVYNSVRDIPYNYFDFIICNLVLCIVTEREVVNIVRNIERELKKGGFAYFGFCNPLIFNVPESNIDFRMQTKHHYEENHNYKKIKKEGNYEIIESHRPIEWYTRIFKEAGLKLVDTIFTPEYELKGRKIKDFVILKVTK